MFEGKDVSRRKEWLKSASSHTREQNRPPPRDQMAEMFRLQINNAVRWSECDAICRSAALGEISRMAVLGTMARCAADFRAIQPHQLGAARPDFDPGTPRHTPGGHEMQCHRARALCDHRRPCWQLGTAAGDLAWRPPSPCPWARPQPPTRHSQACCSAPGRALCAAIIVAHTCTIAELFVRLSTALAAAGGGAGAQRGPAVARRPPRGFAAPGASASARLAPWKGHRRYTFPRRRPRAICGHLG